MRCFCSGPSRTTSVAPQAAAAESYGGSREARQPCSTRPRPSSRVQVSRTSSGRVVTTSRRKPSAASRPRS